MVDQETTTDDPMTTEAPTAVGTAPVPITTPNPDPEPPQAPVPPPPITAPVDEVLRWLANVSTMAGSPDGIDVSTTTRQIDIATPNRHLFTRWQTIIGAVAQSVRHDVLGTTIGAITVYPGLWSVSIHAHVRTTQ